MRLGGPEGTEGVEGAEGSFIRGLRGDFAWPAPVPNPKSRMSTTPSPFVSKKSRASTFLSPLKSKKSVASTMPSPLRSRTDFTEFNADDTTDGAEWSGGGGGGGGGGGSLDHSMMPLETPCVASSRRVCGLLRASGSAPPVLCTGFPNACMRDRMDPPPLRKACSSSSMLLCPSMIAVNKDHHGPAENAL